MQKSRTLFLLSLPSPVSLSFQTRVFWKPLREQWVNPLVPKVGLFEGTGAFEKWGPQRHPHTMGEEPWIQTGSSCPGPWTSIIWNQAMEHGTFSRQRVELPVFPAAVTCVPASDAPSSQPQDWVLKGA